MGAGWSATGIVYIFAQLGWCWDRGNVVRPALKGIPQGLKPISFLAMRPKAEALGT